MLVRLMTGADEQSTTIIGDLFTLSRLFFQYPFIYCGIIDMNAAI